MTLHSIDRDIAACRRCPRLVEWREQIASTKTRRFHGQDYWGKAVPGFGSLDARILIVGLAPAAHGANRTGRMFTGDRSGDWLYRALHKAGFANQPESNHSNDGLHLLDCRVTAAVHCAPPENKPTPEEIRTCGDFLERELDLMPGLRVVVGLGKIAYDRACRVLSDKHGSPGTKVHFGHGAEVSWEGRLHLLGSFHPSQQNTFTGRLTEPMFDSIFERVQRLLND